MTKFNHDILRAKNIHIVYEDQLEIGNIWILRSALSKVYTLVYSFINRLNKNAGKNIFRAECLNCFKSEKSMLITENIQDYAFFYYILRHMLILLLFSSSLNGILPFISSAMFKFNQQGKDIGSGS